MSAQGPSSGQTGFLFGNIDRHGRLDEDYLSDEAKDNLEHIGTKVTEKYDELNQIRESLPGDKNVPAELDEDYDNDQTQQTAPLSQDEFYEDDVGIDDEIEEEDRKKLAGRVLQPSVSRGEDMEEDYDDDEDLETKASGDRSLSGNQNRESRVPPITTLASQSLSIQAVPARAHVRFVENKAVSGALLPPSSSTLLPASSPLIRASSANVGISPKQNLSASPELDPTSKRISTTYTPPRATSEAEFLEQQRRLFQQPSFPLLGLSPSKAPYDSEKDDDPILFSQIFARSPSPLNFGRRPRRPLGFVVENPQNPPVCSDDADLLNRPPSPPIIDPVEVALKNDEESRKILYPSAPEICPRPISVSTDEEDNDSDIVLLAEECSDVIRQSNFPVRTPAPFEIIRWEKDVDWGSPSPDSADDETDWLGTPKSSNVEVPSNENLRTTLNGSENKVVQDPAGDEDDEDEFEDPVEFNFQPTNPVETGSNTNREVKSSDENKDKDNDEDEDDDDDMEWEDGNVLSDSLLPSDHTKPVQENMPEAQSKELLSPKSTGKISNPGNLSELYRTDGVATKATPKSSDVSDALKASKAVPNSNDEDDSIPPQINRVPEDSNEGQDIVMSVLKPNQDLVNGSWVHGIQWDSESDSGGGSIDESDLRKNSRKTIRHQLSCLILDMNDPNMVFERVTDDVDNGENGQNSSPTTITGPLCSDKLSLLLKSTGPQLQQLLQGDSLNISNDVFYVTGAAQHLKLDRGSIIRGLQNAPPATKIQTTPSALSDAELLSFHRPKLNVDKLPKSITIQALRRKRVKGGNAQIAGQIPKKKGELRCSEKDAYRVSVFEYALERQPCILPIPGMASRLFTYARKESSEAVQRAVNAAAGTAQADTIFMAPDEPPPLAAGNIEAGEKPLFVVESQVYTAPAAKIEPHPTDFLLVRHGKSMIIREIDSVISIGMTEPKVEVMTPNTEKYKKYSRERMVLWVMREFQRMSKDNEKKKDSDGKHIRDPPYIEKDEIYSEFPRRRTYPETGLLRALKEMSKFQNGKYFQDENVKSKYNSREQELLRIITPADTASFESMESAWEQILDRGILNFTHPSGQGNILAAAEADRSGLEAGPAVGKYIKSHLLKTPWYRSGNMISAHRLQRKDLLQALSLARIVNDLKEGGEVMEAKLLTLSPAEMNNVLTQVYRFNSKRVPINVEERRSLVREVCQRKGKGAPPPEVSDYPTIIRTVLKKHRDAGLSKGAAIAAQGTSMAGGTFLGVPLQLQRRALEDGEVESLPAEEDDFVPDTNAEKLLASYYSSGAGKRGDGNESNNRRVPKKGRPPNASPLKVGDNIDAGLPSTAGAIRNEKNQKLTGQGESREAQAANEVNGGVASRKRAREGDEGKKPARKKVTRLKVTKRIVNDKGEPQSVVTFVTDPKEIERLLAKKNAPKSSADSPPRKSSDGLKISIDLKRLQGGKAGLMKKKNVLGSEKIRGKMKVNTKQSMDQEVPSVTQNTDEKKIQIGKIKINTKQLKSDKDRAALKRKRSQFSDDVDFRAKKVQKTSRKKRNGTVELNGILESIEDTVRKTEGYVVPGALVLTIARLKDGESPPPGTKANKLANPEGLGLDFTAPVDTKEVPAYKEIIKKPMYLNLIRTNCKNMKYQRSEEFLDDMRLMVNNAKVFNQSPDVQWVVQHAKLLLEVAEEQVERRAEEIQTAENMVALEKSDVKTPGSGSKAKAQKGVKNKPAKDKNGGSGCKKSIEKKKKKKKKSTNNEPITIVDDDSVKEVEQPVEVFDLSTVDDDGNQGVLKGTPLSGVHRPHSSRVQRDGTVFESNGTDDNEIFRSDSFNFSEDNGDGN